MRPQSVDLKDRLVSEGVGVFATDLFIGTMPPNPDANITIKDTGWKKPELNYELEQPGIQVLIRGVKGTYLVTATKAKEAYTALHGFQGVIDVARYILVAAVQTPMYIGQDESSRPLFSINFEVQRTTKA